jgi:general secretion pathway protein K
MLVEAKQVSPNGHSALVEQLVPHLESASTQPAPQRFTAHEEPGAGTGTGTGTGTGRGAGTGTGAGTVGLRVGGVGVGAGPVLVQ